MKCCCVQVYLTGRKDKSGINTIRAKMTLQLALEAQELSQKGYRWIWPLTGKMGLYHAYRLVQELNEWCQSRSTQTIVERLEARTEKEWWNSKEWQNQVVKRVKGIIRRAGQSHRSLVGESKIVSLCSDDLPQVSSLSQQIAALLRGRNLYLEEIVAGLKEMNIIELKPSEVLSLLVPLLVTGKVELVPANLPDEPICLRCGSRQLVMSQCGICGEKTWYCPECREMGESSTCRPLFRRADHAGHFASELAVQPFYRFPLSEYQEKLSRRLQKALEGNEKRDWLLWAVCGAGKTETTFGLVGSVLGAGGRVLYTSPRREVVKQMVERFKLAFSSTIIVGLYGGSEEKLAQAQVTIATVHQLVRFYQAFDLIIFDEVDAYPYKGDARLQELLERSRKKDGRLIYLSATPDKTLLRKAKFGELEVLTLPARFHRKGVPVPELKTAHLPQVPEVEKMPKEVLEWVRITMCKELAQLYVFLPTKKMVEQFGSSLQQVYGRENLQDWVEYTHSQDDERSRKVEAFLRGDFPILVTTTIMERGVTVPKSNVLVLYADVEDIFDTQSLVQMAGRAGRSLAAPHGNVLFVGKRISGAMQQAKEWINRMNAEAHERGLLDVEVDEKPI